MPSTSGEDNRTKDWRMEKLNAYKIKLISKGVLVGSMKMLKLLARKRKSIMF